MSSKKSGPSMQVLASVLQARSVIARKLGQLFGGKRDLYGTLGYKSESELKPEDFYGLYIRQDLAHRIVRIFPEGSWERPPVITDTPDEDASPFETAWDDVATRLRLYSVMERADVLAGIGEYSVLFLGFDDGQDPRQPVKKAKSLLYVQPYGQWSADIQQLDQNTKSPRYGMPELYQLKTYDPGMVGTNVSTRTIIVHHSRIVHIVRNKLESNIYGINELKPILNRLSNIEMLLGGSAEMFWQGAMKGLAFLAKEGYDITQSAAALTEQIDKYVHGFQRYLKLEGVDIKEITPEVESPKDHIDAQVDFVAMAYGIPKRVLRGSERGELASSQDAAAWARRLEHRRGVFNEPEILRSVIDRLIETGALPEPAEGKYAVEWPPLVDQSEKDLAETGEKISRAVSTWYGSASIEAGGVSLATFLTDVVGLPDERVERIRESAEELADYQRGEDNV